MALKQYFVLNELGKKFLDCIADITGKEELREIGLSICIPGEDIFDRYPKAAGYIANSFLMISLRDEDEPLLDLLEKYKRDCNKQ